MKKFVYFFVSALFMVSCNQEEVLVEIPEENAEVPRAIGFETFVDKSSRATGENSTALYDFYPAFHVNGWKTVGETVTQIFNNMVVSYAGDEASYGQYAAEWGETFVPGWYYKNLRYWDKMASNYQFCAYAPVEAINDVVCTADGQITIGSAEAPVTVETKNLMASPADKLAFTGFDYDYMTAVSNEKLDKVSLNFKHLQAKLNIRIRLNESVTTAQAVEITEIRVHNLGNKGYYDNKATGEGIVSGWKLATGDADYVPAVTADYPINGSDPLNNYYVLEQLILPQTIQKAATTAPSLDEFAEACLYVEYTIGGEVFKSYSPLSNIFATTETYNLEGGKQYTINVIVGPSPIEFTVDVAEWADAVEKDKEMN